MFKALKGPFFGLLAVVALTWITHGMAVEITTGHEVSTSGRRAIFKKGLAWAAEALGPTGVLVVGGLAAAGMVAWAVASLRKPAKTS